MPKCELDFHMAQSGEVSVNNRMWLEAADGKGQAPLRLYGKEIKAQALRVEDWQGEGVEGWQLQTDAEGLLISQLPAQVCVIVSTKLKPETNTSLMGLYRSKGLYCTQCEPEGFRRITFFPDRPDVLTRFRCRIQAPQESATLLANGNLVESGPVEGAEGEHYVVWEDPFPKPSYLFALVAGNLQRLEDSYRTMSGRDVQLHLYARSEHISRLGFALKALRDAMRWDEECYSREYDLDTFMIVAVDDFNFGAMENKGLNVFNSAVLLADPLTTTDDGYERIRSVVAHEYFHNWSGNRVTLRDWFQLSLKEGFTVFRDQTFSEQTGNELVERLKSVEFLRRVQFREDAGALAHQVRPDHYAEINNFYTATVYEKGAEVVRSLRTLIGPQAFRRGAETFFERHDGQAARVEDFVTAMHDASPTFDREHFMRWYTCAGTPKVELKERWAEDTQVLHLEAVQQLKDSDPLLIPLRCGFINEQGDSVSVQVDDGEVAEEQVLRLEQAQQRWQIRTTDGQRPVVSSLRGFSAPVILEHERAGEHDLELLARFDKDMFSRWEAVQLEMRQQMKSVIEAPALGNAVSSDTLLAVLSSLLDDQKLELSALAIMLTPPADLMYDYRPVKFEESYAARETLLDTMARELHESIAERYSGLASVAGDDHSQKATEIRALRRCLLGLLARKDDLWLDRALLQVKEADNLTDVLAGLRVLMVAKSDRAAPLRDQALSYYEQRFAGEPLAMDHWFAVQAQRPSEDALQSCQKLLSHQAYKDNSTNPNRVRSLLGACGQNPHAFHRKDGKGYAFMVDRIVEMDKINPMLSARLAIFFSDWRQWDKSRAALQKQALEQLLSIEGATTDLGEQVKRMLGQTS